MLIYRAMERSDHSCIRATSAPDGSRAYDIALSPADLPPVTGRALEAAWHAAHEAAEAGRAGPARGFRFRPVAGAATDLLVRDRDARAWAEAIDRRGGARGGLHTVMGLSLCMRLLALIDLAARVDWVRARCGLRQRHAAIDPALLRAAAAATLTETAAFDEAAVAARLASAPGCAQAGAFTIGACR